MRTYLLFDDNHENFYTGRITRNDDELIEEVRALEIGDEYMFTETTGLIREK
tara:strand:- start:357 stop:512 length:156 start_codon:yes stop_codon:yes gene_type:complete